MAGFLICPLSFPINLLYIYSGFLQTKRGNMKPIGHRKLLRLLSVHLGSSP